MHSLGKCCYSADIQPLGAFASSRRMGAQHFTHNPLETELHDTAVLQFPSEIILPSSQRETVPTISAWC